MLISLGNKSSVETSGRKSVLVSIKFLGVENLTGLLSNSVCKVGVLGDTGSVTSIARNNSRFLLSRGFNAHVVSRSTVEVLVGPFEELVLVVLFVHTGIAHVEFSLGLQESGLLCHFCN